MYSEYEPQQSPAHIKKTCAECAIMCRVIAVLMNNNPNNNSDIDDTDVDINEENDTNDKKNNNKNNQFKIDSDEKIVLLHPVILKIGQKLILTAQSLYMKIFSTKINYRDLLSEKIPKALQINVNIISCKELE